MSHFSLKRTVGGGGGGRGDVSGKIRRVVVGGGGRVGVGVAVRGQGTMAPLS